MLFRHIYDNQTSGQLSFDEKILETENSLLMEKCASQDALTILKIESQGVNNPSQ